MSVQSKRFEIANREVRPMSKGMSRREFTKASAVIDQVLMTESFSLAFAQELESIKGVGPTTIIVYQAE